MINKQVAVVSLGCDKNRVDTENALAFLVDNGYRITTDFSVASIIVVNTCAFIEDAKKEAIENILDAAEYKKTGACKGLIVTGCLPQKYKKEIENSLPEVDAFLGVCEYEKIALIADKLLAQPLKKKVPEDATSTFNKGQKNKAAGKKTAFAQRIITTPPHYAYLRIADGCNNRCSYCTIPSIRGAYKSREINSLIDEAKWLVDSGAKEIILVAQDVTSYGIDLYNKHRLLELLQGLEKINDIYKIRLLYCYPELVQDSLIEFISSTEKMAKYIDIPFQHFSNKILSLMNRRNTKEQAARLIKKIKEQNKSIAIRSTVIVGFPTEGDSEFLELCDFIKEYKLDHLGIFEYSKEDGTAASKLKQQISKKEKQARKNIVSEIAYNNALEKNKKIIGQTRLVTYEGIDFNNNLFIGRDEYNAPEIDSAILFSSKKPCLIGSRYLVDIKGNKDYDLIGERVE